MIKRIRTIHSMRDRITVHNQDAALFIEEYAWRNQATLFVDPPYVEKGHTLYRHFYTEDQHENVARILNQFHHEFPNADIIITYDDHPLIRSLYDTYGEIIELGRSFSV